MKLAVGDDVLRVKEAILANRWVCISGEDAGRVAEWATDISRANLLLVGRTGSGKSVLIQVLWPLFKAPANGIAGPWSKLKDDRYRAEPMIIDHTNLGLTIRDKQMAKAAEEMIDGACEGPLLVTSFSDLSGLKGEWVRVTLDSEKAKEDWRKRDKERAMEDQNERG